MLQRQNDKMAEDTSHTNDEESGDTRELDVNNDDVPSGPDTSVDGVTLASDESVGTANSRSEVVSSEAPVTRDVNHDDVPSGSDTSVDGVALASDASAGTANSLSEVISSEAPVTRVTSRSRKRWVSQILSYNILQCIHVRGIEFAGPDGLSRAQWLRAWFEPRTVASCMV